MTETRLLLKKTSDGRTIVLTGETLVGRVPPATLLLSEGHASKRHAKLTVSPEGVALEDLNSTNGTYVNGSRINARVLLKSGDRVRFDLEEFQPSGSAPAAPAPAPAPAPAAAPAAAPGSGAPPKPAQAAPPRAEPKPSPPPERKKNPIVDASPATLFINPKDILKEMPRAAPRRPSAGASAMPCLLVGSGESSGMEICLIRGADDSQGWTVGSDEGRDVRLSDSGVSGLHARIVSEGERWKVVDLMSANGTWVNDKKGSVSYLKDGDHLKFGPVECILHLPKGRAPAKVVAPPVETSKRKSPLLVAAGVLLVIVLLLLAYGLLK
jgi:pSer/pThr/pTyr-binding forkhead associated (FHA) protein